MIPALTHPGTRLRRPRRNTEPFANARAPSANRHPPKSRISNLKSSIPSPSHRGQQLPAPRPPQWIRQLLAAGLALVLGTGCQTVQDSSLTYRLWHPTDSGNLSSEPATDNLLTILEDTQHQDLLVQYDAWSDKKRALVRRAYLLMLNQERIAARKKPHFVDPSMADSLAPISVVASVIAVSPDAPWTAVYPESLDGRPAFGLYQQGKPVGLYPLPSYSETAGTTTARVLLTPPAVVGDLVMVGVVASVVAFYSWVFLGAPGS